MKNLFLFSLLLHIFFISCSKENISQGQTDWLIPVNEVRDGGPGKDGIPSIDNPQFIRIDQVDFLSDNDLVVGMVHNNVVRAYPHPIMDWHEIVNDELGNLEVALTYCPLTGTAVAWNRKNNGQSTTFGVSGKLFNTNLMPYDRDSDSYWSQMSLNCVNGDRIGEVIETFPIIETTWATWKSMYPNSEILSTQTGFSRNYNRYPYGDYRTNNNNVIFPVSPRDTRLPSKERVLAVLNETVNRVYSINLFENPRVIYDQIGDDPIIVIGAKDENFIVAFRNQGLNDWTVDLTKLPVIATDNEGNELDINGRIVAGPLAGTQLDHPTAYIGFWLSFGAFYPGIEIYVE
ncbi:MAG: DUF3179 domain-containing protein [Bacteroidota bacterium]